MRKEASSSCIVSPLLALLTRQLLSTSAHAVLGFVVVFGCVTDCFTYSAVAELTALLTRQLLSTSAHAVLGFVVVFGVVFQAAVGSRKVYI